MKFIKEPRSFSATEMKGLECFMLGQKPFFLFFQIKVSCSQDTKPIHIIGRHICSFSSIISRVDYISFV